MLRNTPGRPPIGRVAMTPAERQLRYRKLAKKRRRAANCEWYTPPDIIALAVEVMGDIDLDPASCAAANETVGAKVFHTLADDGLLQEWHGRVWLNPPYSKIASFVDKLIDEMASSTGDGSHHADGQFQRCGMVSGGGRMGLGYLPPGAADQVCLAARPRASIAANWSAI